MNGIPIKYICLIMLHMYVVDTCTYMKKTYLVGLDKLWAIPGQHSVSSLRNSLSSTPPVYTRKAHQNTSGSAVSELMRFIHHIITYVVPATPRAINWARRLIQKPPVTGWAGSNEATKDTHTHWSTSTWKKPYLVGPDKLYERSLDSAVSSLLALISREYAYIHIYVHVCTLTCLSELLHASGLPCLFSEVCFLSEFCYCAKHGFPCPVHPFVAIHYILCVPAPLSDYQWMT